MQNGKLMTNEVLRDISRNLYDVLVMETNDNLATRGSVLMAMLSVYLCECNSVRKPGIDTKDLVRSFMSVLEIDTMKLINEYADKIEQETKQ